MKRILLSILLVAIALLAFPQSPTRIVNMRPAYPLAIGESTIDSLVYSHNGICLFDIIQDNLPAYEIGHIFAQTVRYTEEGHGFYIKADSLHSNQVTYSYQTDTIPRGPIEFNSTTGRFIFYPLSSDYQSFVVRFTAASPTDTVWEDVVFDLMTEVVPEQYAFNSEGTMPNGEDYTLILSTNMGSMFFNGENRNVFSYSISGKDIVFDNNIQNKVWGLSGREDIYELNIYAEKLTIRSPLLFPQCNVTIYAKEIIFEDQTGEISFINTTPSPIEVYTDGMGRNGANAGNINLYVKDLRANTAKRFILNGGNGQSTNRNGTPGNGGNGGVMSSNINVQSFCDFARGSCGIKFNVDTLSSNHHGAIIGAGTIGEIGNFILEDSPYKFLHPYYIAPVIRYVNDVYINNYTNTSYQICKEYIQLIEQYFEVSICDTCTQEEDRELMSELTELNSLLGNLELGLDYFGNSIGWVPLLSFEVMLANYREEVDRAIPMLYLYYWLTKIDRTLQEFIDAKNLAADGVVQNIQSLRSSLNSLIANIPIFQDKISELEVKISEVNYKIELVEARLMEKARHKVKKQHKIKKAAATCKAIASVASFCGPYGVAVAGVLNTASNIISNAAYVTGALDINSDYANYFPYVDTTTYSLTTLLSSVKTQIDNFDLSLITTDGHYLENQYNSISSIVSPITNTVNDVTNAIKHNSVSDAEVQAVFDALCANDNEWKSLQTDLKRLDDTKKEVQKMLEDMRNLIPSITSNISNSIVALDAFRVDVFTNNSKRDLYAMQYLKKMEQQAKNRLIKYHYYLRKAYEFRMLKPYTGEYNLVNMFERFENLATNMVYDSLVDYTNYETMSAVFDTVISGIVQEVIDDYSTNTPEQSVPITIVLPREQLDILNSDGILTLNFYEMGIFSPDEENIRIVDLGVYYLGTHVNGNVGSSGYMDLNMTHQGISRFRKNGQIYWFDHISRTTTRPHTWGVRYDANTHTSTPIQPSFASSSLLYSILNNNSTNMMLFSRPSAWGDISVSKKVHSSSGGADIVIDSLILQLQYDFTPRPNGIRNIDITTNEGLLPYIVCSEVDRNGRSNGNGNLNRSYNESNQTVTFSAAEQYGTWYFLNWTDRAGNIVSDSMNLTVSRSTDQFYRANYERRVPILSVPDTIEVNFSGGIQTVQVANIGSGDTEMDWYVSDSLSSWIHLNSVAEGIDDGMFSFIFDANESGTYRIDSLEIFAPETDVMSKMIYIVQVDCTVYNVTANVVPEGAGTVSGTGFFSPHETATLTATPIEDCSFVSWELNGQVVSTNPVYSFEVNNNIQLTANFSCEDMVSVTAEVSPLNSGNVYGTGLYHPNEVVTLHAIPFDGYSFANWTYSDIVLSDNQEYTFVVTNDMHYIAHFQNDVGVNRYEKDALNIYPNPTKETVNITGSNIYSVTIYSALGKEVARRNVNGENLVTLDISDLPCGLYIFVVSANNHLTHKKVVKSK